VWICIEPFLSSLEKVALKHGLLLEVVGSFATGLWSTFSDIDINLVPIENEYCNFEAILERIYRTLKSRRAELGISEALFSRGKVNAIKLALSERFGNLVVDIAVFYRNNQNRAYVTYILETLAAYPQVKPLFLVLKKTCETFDLHDHLFGGLKTYTLFLMVYSIAKNLPGQNAGELLNQVALYYGFYYEQEFDCSEEGWQWAGEGEDYPRPVFNFIDPLNPKNNVGGKNTRVRAMQDMFRAIYLAVNQLHQRPYLHQIFQLHSIF
jgi:DNA polymerase sigma